MIKKFTAVFLGLLAACVFASAQDMMKADELFDAGQYQAAHDEYVKAAEAEERGPNLYKAQLRSAECLKNLFRYEEAAKLFDTYPLPKEPVWEARFLIYRTFFASQGAQIYISSLTTLEDGQEKDYERLFALRKELINEPIQNETLILNLKDTDLEAMPTLYDFTAEKIKNYYLQKDNKNMVKEVLKETADLNGVNRTLAKQNALIDFILYAYDGEEEVDALFKLADYKDKFAPAKIKEEQPAVAAPEKKTSFFVRLFGGAKNEAPAVNASPVIKPAYAPSAPLARARARAIYEAAQIANNNSQYERAYEACAYAAQNNFDYYYTTLCRRMMENIELPVLDMQDQPLAQNPATVKYNARVRNINTIYTRVYPTNEPELAKFKYSTRNSYDYLRRLNSDALKHFLAKEPVTEVQTPLTYDEKYGYKEISVSLPPSEKGLFVVLHSDVQAPVVGKSEIRGAILNLSDIMLLSSSGIEGAQADFTYDAQAPNKTVRANVFEFYVLNPKTGAPVPGAAIDAYEGYNTGRVRHFTSNKDGAAHADMSINLNYTFYKNNLSLDPLAVKDGALAYLSNAVYFNYQTEYPYLVFVETDRAVYRPEQEVSLKATVLERTPKGYKTLGINRKVKIDIYDVNYKLVTTGNATLSDMGSVAYKFTLPAGRLLGNYSANVSLIGTDASGHANFKVEEYKRPEFEVNIKDAAAPWTYGQQAQVEGSVNYYFGGPVANAEIDYKVIKENYIPFFYWWWRIPVNAAREEVAHGKITADADGNFTFGFTPGDKEPTTRFVVEINARDAGGRTISSTKNFLAAKENIFFKLDVPTGFMTAEKPYNIDVTLVDINQTPIDGKIKMQLYSLEQQYKEPAYVSDNTKWEEYFTDTKELEEIFLTEIPSGKKQQTVTLPALKEGVYRLKLTSGTAEQKMLLLSVSDGQTLKLPAVVIPERPKYYPGETMRVLVGADKLQKAKYFNLIKNGFVLEKNIVPAGGVSLVEVAIKEEHRGGFNFSFFGVSDYKTYSANTHIDVPRNNMDLNVKLTAPAAVKPGEKVTWTLAARDYKNNPVSGEATVRVYDRSLDYYAKLEPSIKLENLFYDTAWRSAANIVSSLFSVYPASLGYDREWASYPQTKPLPHLNMEYSPRRYARGAVMYKTSAVMDEWGEDFEVMESAAPVATSGARSMDTNMLTFAGGAAVKEEAAAGGSIRENMAETAYFAPQIKVTNGAAAFGFTMPERLTSWNILATVLTKDVKLGSVTAQTVTKKDLMVRLEMPRYLRENDASQIKALVNNDTKTALTAEVSLLGFDDQQRVQKLTVPAGGQSVAVWDVNAKTGARILKLTAVARAGALSDGETKELPVLPSRERVVDSKVISLKEGANALALNLPADKTREYEAISLQVDPSLLLPVLNTVPKLIDYSYLYETTPSIINKYVPLAIINSFYKKYPELKAAVTKIPARGTITPAWEQEDPVRLLMLQETPWQNAAEGREAFFGKIIDIFNPKTVSKIESSSLNKLENYQNSDGSYSWLPGGKGDTYITLYVLEAFSEALSHGARISDSAAKKAVKYVTPEIEKLLKKSMREDEYNVALALYASYVISSFPADWYEKTTIAAWADYAAKQEKFMTPLGKLYAANVYHRLGNKVLSDRYLDQALDMMRVDPTTGAYFTPEAKSWLWYSDTLEKHALAMRTLLRLRPEDARIDELLKWLLFNRKSNEWNNTKTAASAVYAMLDVMRAKSAFDKETSYNITWGKVNEKLTYKPFDFVAKPPVYTAYGADATDKELSAQIYKTGKVADFASLSAIYSTDALIGKSEEGLLNVDRKYFVNGKEISSGDTVNVGDEIEVRLLIKTSSQFEYVLVKDPRGAGFESSALLSGWKWDLLPRYEELKDSATNFFIDWLPHGEYTLKYTIRPTTPGDYKIGAAVIQSMFAPEFAAHSAAVTLKVK